MRPKKVILLVDPDEENLSVLKYILETHAFRVLEAGNVETATALFTDNIVDLVMASGHISEKVTGNDLCSSLKQKASHVPMVLLGDEATFKGDTRGADAVLIAATIRTAELLERVRIMSARKRGPRKGVTNLVPVAV